MLPKTLGTMLNDKVSTTATKKHLFLFALFFCMRENSKLRLIGKRIAAATHEKIPWVPERALKPMGWRSKEKALKRIQESGLPKQVQDFLCALAADPLASAFEINTCSGIQAP